MLVVPYFVKKSNSNWLTLGLFLCEGGRSVWSVDDMTDKEIKAMLKENGFPVLSLQHLGQTVYASINLDAIKMSDFYMWADVDPMKADEDVWRTIQIPLDLWSCPVFKSYFWKSAGLPFTIDDALVRT